MNKEPIKDYITQPIPVPDDGKGFKVVFRDGTKTPLLTKEDAEYVLSQRSKLCLRSAVRRSLREQANRLKEQSNDN